MIPFRIKILMLSLLTAASDAAAQEMCDTLVDKRVTMYISARPPMLPADNAIIPEPLENGDLIAIVSPASESANSDFCQMVDIIESEGFQAYVSPHAEGRNGYYSGTVEERLSDLTDAILNPDVKAIICTRGGYGAVHLLAGLDSLPIRDNPKWLVGFSDISALHAIMAHHGIASIHGPMGINLKLHDGEPSPSCRALFGILKGHHATYEIEPHPYNRTGETYGQLAGGNLAVINGLISTPFDVIKPGSILFIEDVAEPVYKIERQLYQLKLNGILENLAGLIVGDFTETDEQAMEAMIHEMVAGYDYPVAFGVPAGHARVNIPLVLGAPIMMEVTDEGTTLIQ